MGTFGAIGLQKGPSGGFFQGHIKFKKNMAEGGTVLLGFLRAE